MASMKWTHVEVYTKVSEFLGLGSSPAGTDLTKVKDITRRGYLKFLMPIIPSDSEIYIWSWLRQPWKLKLEPNKWEYPLPTDWDRFYRKIEFDVDQRTNTMVKTSEQKIMANRNLLEFSSFPTAYAIRTAKYDPSVGSTKELIMYPTPSERTIVNCTYVMTPPKMENDGDFFIGSVLESDAILQCALAVAENVQDEVIGVETARAVELVQALVRKDKGVAPDTVGTVRDTNISHGSIFSYRDWWIPRGTITVYGQEL